MTPSVEDVIERLQGLSNTLANEDEDAVLDAIELLDLLRWRDVSSEPPEPYRTVIGMDHQEHGMTLRDWFAGQALVGILAHHNGPAGDWAKSSIHAYEVAEAMMESLKQFSPDAFIYVDVVTVGNKCGSHIQDVNYSYSRIRDAQKEFASLIIKVGTSIE